MFYSFNKKEAVTQLFICEFWQFFRNTYFVKNLRTAAPDLNNSKL